MDGSQWIGLRGRLTGKPHDLNGNINGLRVRFSRPETNPLRLTIGFSGKQAMPAMPRMPCLGEERTISY